MYKTGAQLGIIIMAEKYKPIKDEKHKASVEIITEKQGERHTSNVAK